MRFENSAERRVWNGWIVIYSLESHWILRVWKICCCCRWRSKSDWTISGLVVLKSIHWVQSGMCPMLDVFKHLFTVFVSRGQKNLLCIGFLCLPVREDEALQSAEKPLAGKENTSINKTNLFNISFKSNCFTNQTKWDELINTIVFWVHRFIHIEHSEINLLWRLNRVWVSI